MYIGATQVREFRRLTFEIVFVSPPAGITFELKSVEQHAVHEIKIICNNKINDDNDDRDAYDRMKLWTQLRENDKRVTKSQ